MRGGEAGIDDARDISPFPAEPGRTPEPPMDAVQTFPFEVLSMNLNAAVFAVVLSVFTLCGSAFADQETSGGGSQNTGGGSGGKDAAFCIAHPELCEATGH